MKTLDRWIAFGKTAQSGRLTPFPLDIPFRFTEQTLLLGFHRVWNWRKKVRAHPHGLNEKTLSLPMRLRASSHWHGLLKRERDSRSVHCRNTGKVGLMVPSPTRSLLEHQLYGEQVYVISDITCQLFFMDFS